MPNPPNPPPDEPAPSACPSWCWAALTQARHAVWRYRSADGSWTWGGDVPAVVRDVATADDLAARLEDNAAVGLRAALADAAAGAPLDLELLFRTHGAPPTRIHFRGGPLGDGEVVGTAAEACGDPSWLPVLWEMAQNIGALSGDAFNRKAIQELARELGADAVVALRAAPRGEEQGPLGRILYGWIDDEWVEPFDWGDLRHPCPVLDGEPAYRAEGARQAHPHDTLLEDLEVEAYAAEPMRSERGERLGVLAVLWRTPAPSLDLAQAAVPVIAGRIAAELERIETEEGLARTQARLAQIVDLAPDVAIQGYDREGRVVFWNLASERIFGFAADEVLGRRLDEFLISPEEHAHFVTRLRDLERRGAAEDPIEVGYTRADGTPGTCLSSVFAVAGDGPEPLFVCMDVDTTALRQAERELRESERRMFTFMQSSGLGYWEFDVESQLFHIKSIRPGLPAGTVVTVTWAQSLQTLHPDDHAIVNEAFRRVYAGETDELLTEHRVDHGDGLYRWLMGRGRVVERDADGRPRLIAGTHIDITERRAHEELIAASEARYSNLYHLLPDAVVVLDHASGEILDANQAFGRLLGQPAETAVGRYADEVGLGFLAPGTVASRQVFQTGFQELEGEMPGRDGPVHLLVSARLWVMDERPCVIALLRDLTAHRRGERLSAAQHRRLQALRAVDVAIASSFDLRVTLGILVDQAVALLGGHAARVLRLDPGAQELHEVVQRGLRPCPRNTAIRVAETPEARAILERRRLTVPAAAGSIVPVPDALPEGGVGTCHVVPIVGRGRVVGLLELWADEPADDEDWFPFLESLAGQAAIAIDNAALFEDLQRANLNATIALEQVLECWAKEEEGMRPGAAGSARRVARLATDLGRAMELPESEIVHLRRAALLRDVGMSRVPADVLAKTGALDEAEWGVVRHHPEIGVALLRSVPSMADAAPIILHHHERWDGDGYPAGLRGEQIPIGARVLAVADAFVALTSDRPHRTAAEAEAAAEAIRREAGGRYDPAVVEVLAAWLEEQGA